MKTLDQIGIECQTDKATQFTRTYAKPKGYTVQYEKFFEPLRNQPIKFLEIGAAGGESIKMWLDYFPNAFIYGIDIVSHTNPWNTPGADTHPRYKFLQGDQSDPTMWECLKANWGSDWDIVIDDGSHFSKDVIMAFNCLWPSVRPGGLYCVEDLGVACAPASIFITPGTVNHLDWLRNVGWSMHLGVGDVAEIHMSPELAVIRKKS